MEYVDVEGAGDEAERECEEGGSNVGRIDLILRGIDNLGKEQREQHEGAELDGSGEPVEHVHSEGMGVIQHRDGE